MDIIFFAAIAIFIFFKLRENLGKISDEEKEKIIKQRQEKIAKLQEQIVKQIETAVNVSEQNNQASEKIVENLDDNLKQTLNKIFQECKISAEFFINGAKSCFEMVIKAFATHDLDTLKFLLSEKIFENFKNVIEDRRKQDKALNSNVIAIEKAEILSASISENIAFVTVKFTSKQINYFTNNQGDIIEGKKDEISELNDVWTFKKDLSVSDPNWKISATG